MLSLVNFDWKYSANQENTKEIIMFTISDIKSPVCTSSNSQRFKAETEKDIASQCESHTVAINPNIKSPIRKGPSVPILSVQPRVPASPSRITALEKAAELMLAGMFSGGDNSE